MQCPIDKTEMEEGWLAPGRWITGPMKKLSWWIRPMQSLTVKSILAVAWRCPKCGKVELTTEVK